MQNCGPFTNPFRRYAGRALLGGGVWAIFLGSVAFAQSQPTHITHPASPATVPDTAAQVADLKKQVAALKSELQLLSEGYLKAVDDFDKAKSSLESLWSQFNTTRLDVWNLQSTNSVTINPGTANGFKPIDTEAGRLLVLIDKFEPYLTGYRMYFQIGNLTSGRLTDYTVNLEWSHKFKYEVEDYEKWTAGKKKLTIQTPTVLEPGKWNPTNIVLPDTELKNLEYLEMKIETSGVSLGKR